MSILSLSHLPDITFVTTDPETVRKKLIAEFERVTNRTLYPGNPERLFLEALAYVISTLSEQVDFAGKQNLVAYAQGAHLDHLGIESATPRLNAQPATAMFRFSVKQALDWSVEILKGTRIATADGNVVFATNAYAVIASGATFVEVEATATESGTKANNLVAGQVNSLVDPLPYIASVSNVTQTTAGADDEHDADYRSRIPLAREAYTCAGTAGQYEYLVKQVSKDIADVGIYTVIPGTVGVCPIMKNGSLPDEDVLEAIRKKLNPYDAVPLTDTLKVHAPEEVHFTITGTWFLTRSDEALSGSIGAMVEQALIEYKEWQHSKPGRDINPDHLIKLVKLAGAKRLALTTPTFTQLSPYQIARCDEIALTFGGVEDE